MSLRIIYGKSGSGKSTFCFEEIRKRRREEKKIYIITPEQFSFTAEQMLMETIGSNSVMEAEVLTFERMAYRVLNEVGGQDKKHLSQAGKAMIFYHVLKEKKNELTFINKSDENIDLIDRARCV